MIINTVNDNLINIHAHSSHPLSLSKFFVLFVLSKLHFQAIFEPLEENYDALASVSSVIEALDWVPKLKKIKSAGNQLEISWKTAGEK